ncbi:MAG: hypothetical protein H7Y36_11885 [Armatimonadetes bacterium]|nr:hypothetical protein [Akkermansiaceae bacterium]
MKTIVLNSTACRLALAIFVLPATSGVSYSAPDVPRGTLAVDRDLVRVGTRSNLTWNIEYPSINIEIEPTGTIIPKEPLKMRVRVLGVAFQSGNTLLPLDAYWALNGGAWISFFYGTGPTVNQSAILIEKQLAANDRVDFGARGWGGTAWLPFNHTRNVTKYVTVLKKGSTAPSYAPAYNQASAASFLRPYIDSTGKIIIGERDLIVLWESSTANPCTTYFDMQDLVVLLAFE